MTNFKTLGVMIDVSRNAVMTVDALKRFAKLLKRMGYNTLLLYMEDTYYMESDPYIGYMRARYTPEELREIDEYAASLHMEVIPCIQTLAHLKNVIKWNKYPNDNSGILLVGAEETYALIDRMLGFFKGIFRSDKIHIGMDEAHDLGRGVYMDKNGYREQSDILKEHLDRVNDLCKKHGFDPMIWSDMFFRPWNGDYYTDTIVEMPREYVKACPKNVIPIYWDYYSKNYDRYSAMLENHKQLSKKTWFAGGIWGWSGLIPHNAYSIETMRPAIDSCRDNGCRNIFFTLWGDDGADCSHYSQLPALFYLAQYAKGESDEAVIKEKFKRFIGIDFDDYMLIDSPNYIAGNEKAADTPCNPSKYMLYSDLFNGFLDYTVSKGGDLRYDAMSEKLHQIAKKSRKYGYVFESAACLCDILSVKYELGVRTRWSYQNGRKWDLVLLANREYTVLLTLIKKYKDAFEKQWMLENKSCGFDSQEIRLAGLAARVEYCRSRLFDFTDGKTDRIEELEANILPFGGRKSGESICYNITREIMTASVFSQ